MQNRFKFRLFDKSINEMSYDVCVGFVKDSGKTDDWVCADTSQGQINYRNEDIDNIILMQCTGLKDKNGKLIYEGDILKDKYATLYTVSWNLKGFWEADTFALAGFTQTISEDMEIIGNIYETPELLKGEE